MPRIAIGDLKQESHSFSPVPGDWTHFRESGYLLRGNQVLEKLAGTASEIGGCLRVAGRSAPVEVVPLLAAGTGASAGPMRRPVFDALLFELLQRLQGAGTVDGVYLSLHGAMVAEGLDDATGEVLRAVRDLIGPAVWLTVSCDLHANVTRLMVDSANALVGYQTFPHVDLDRAGARATEILLSAISGSVRPRMLLCRLPMVLPAENAQTTEGPMAEVMREVIAMEKEPEVLSASAFCVQPWLDLPDVGCSVLVISDGGIEPFLGRALQVADAFWERRERFAVTREPLRQALERTLRSDRRPFVLSDGADAPSSGSSGDSTEILSALLAMNYREPALLNVVDPEAVEMAIQAGVGSTLTVCLGGKLAPDFYRPVEFTGRVRTISDGRFVHKSAGYRGLEFQRGRTVLLQSDRISVVVMERPVLQWDPEFYRSMGLEPREAKLVIVKSPTCFREAYGPLAAEILVTDSKGIASSDLGSFPWQRIGRPIYPLDDPQTWCVPPTGFVHKAESPS